MPLLACISAAVVAADNTAAAPPPRGSRVAQQRRLQEDEENMSRWCSGILRQGQCGGIPASLCPRFCSNTSATGPRAPVTVETGFHASCAVLLRLEGGCAHDLSSDDPTLAARTRVGDVCPDECSGRGRCAAAVVDVSFLGAPAESDRVQVETVGEVCVDAGAKFAGEGHIELPLDSAYTTDGHFSLSVWLLKAESEVWKPDASSGRPRQVIFSHQQNPGQHSWLGFEIALWRGPWLVSWTLSVSLSGIGFHTYAVDLYRDEVPKWTNLLVAVSHDHVSVFADGVLLEPILVDQNLALFLPESACDGGATGLSFDRLARCGAVTQSSLQNGWQPGLSIDGDRATRVLNGQNDNRCSGTLADDSLNSESSWWQIDLGCEVIVSHVDIWYPSGSLARHGGAGILVSDTDDYHATEAKLCGRIRDQQPPTNFDTTAVIRCDGQYEPVTGRYVTIMFPGEDHKKPIRVCEVEVWGRLSTESSGGFRGGHGLARTATIGANSIGTENLHASVAMLELYAKALTESERTCVLKDGQLLVQNGRMDQNAHSPCSSIEPMGAVSTGCTSRARSDEMRHFPGGEQPSIDDGSCVFPVQDVNAIVEYGEVNATDTWQHVQLHQPFKTPVVLCSVLTRESTTQAVVRIRNVRQTSGGFWGVEVRIERKFCHFSNSGQGQYMQRVNLLVVEGGISSDGWQASILTVHDREWHRVSLLSRVGNTSSAPVVVSQVQTYDNRTSFVTTRQQHLVGPGAESGFFLQMQGEGIMCRDGEFYGEYYDNLQLAGSPRTACETGIPHWDWQTCCSGYPPIPHGTESATPTQFSVRWTTRIIVASETVFVFTSTSNPGSRILVDDTVVLDKWSECCTKFTSDATTLSEGHHVLALEYRSGLDDGEAVESPFAELSWTVRGQEFVTGNVTTGLGSAAEIADDVGWLAFTTATGTIQGRGRFESGYVPRIQSASRVALRFSQSFYSSQPWIFGSVVSTSNLAAHLRLLDSDARMAAADLAIEYGVCSIFSEPADEKIGWLALAPPAEMHSELLISRPTAQADVDALLSINSVFRFPSYFHWQNGSDPCRERWPGIECQTDALGTPRVVVLDVHNIDLANQNIPWSAISQLSELTELSLWNCGLSGPLDGDALCRLKRLEVLVLSENELRGLLPECISSLPVQFMWLNDNNLRQGPRVLSAFGQFLKQLPQLNLKSNRWAPLLQSDKAALQVLHQDLNMPQDLHGWDFGYEYTWNWEPCEDNQRMRYAEYEVSHRSFSAGVPFQGFTIELDFDFPFHSEVERTVNVGNNGDLALGRKWTYARGQSSTASEWRSEMKYVGCYNNYNVEACPGSDEECRSQISWQDTDFNIGAGVNRMNPGEPSHERCALMCTTNDFQYMGLIWQDGCSCGNSYFALVAGDKCGEDGEFVGRGNNPGVSFQMAVFELPYLAWALAEDDLSRAGDTSCWSTTSQLVPNHYTIMEEADAQTLSSQGDDYFSEHLCPAWRNYLSPACDAEDQRSCEESPAPSGNIIYDGGQDMYDVGNLISTSLMGNCGSDPHGCALGSIQYQDDFSRVPSNCFGQDGHYTMQKLNGMWTLFTTITHDQPLDLYILGNLGADSTGTVTEQVFSAPPYKGFVKMVCGAADGDPSVNHLLIVDSHQGTPTHSCDYINGASCSGANSNLDDDILAGIAVGSPLLYLLYSNAGGYCMKTDEHRSIFDIATLCIRSADPFSALHQVEGIGSQLLVEVDVDDSAHIIYDGRAAYTGWNRGLPRLTHGPSGFDNAIQFAEDEWLQLGDGIELQSPWTFDCWVHIQQSLLEGTERDLVFLSAADGTAYVALSYNGTTPGSGIISSVSDGWHRLTVIHDSNDTTTMLFLIDGNAIESIPPVYPASMCSNTDWQSGTVPCVMNPFAIGNRPDGTAPILLPVHRLRLFDGRLTLGQLETYGLQSGNERPYIVENSRLIKVEKGIDALEIQWNTFGWNVDVHHQVQMSIDDVGKVTVFGTNQSSSRDRALEAVASLVNLHNWTAPSGCTGVAVDYTDSDACFDLWDGVVCSNSDWPVGSEQCQSRLPCSVLGWLSDLHGSTDVCGTSLLVASPGSDDLCVREASAKDAESLCDEMGGRLCRVEELEQDEGDSQACGYNTIFAWTWIETPAGSCESGNQSLGYPARPGMWVSFGSATPSNTLFEVQLRFEGRVGSIEVQGVFDGNAAAARGPTPTVHDSANGRMLRWNSTTNFGPFFIHLELADISEYSVTAVTPPVYSWSMLSAGTRPSTGDMSVFTVAPGSHLPLPFRFEFFGIEYNSTWVSKDGYISFERPRSSSFRGAEFLHQAILAAAGDYDADHDGATLTVASNSTEWRVSWHAPIFSSSLFSDVSLALHADGAIDLEWTQIEMFAGIGSLATELQCYYSFEVLGESASVVHDDSGRGNDGTLRIQSGSDDSNGAARVFSIDTTPHNVPSWWAEAANVGGHESMGSAQACTHGNSLDAPGMLVVGEPGTVEFLPAGNYLPASRCRWLIVCRTGSPTMTFTSFDTESEYDPMSVYNGASVTDPVLVRLSGFGSGEDDGHGAESGRDATRHEAYDPIRTYRQQPPVWQQSLVGNGTSLLVTFFSDFGTQGPGFSFEHNCSVDSAASNSSTSQSESAVHSSSGKPVALDGKKAQSLLGDAYIKLPPMVIGGSLTVSAWVRLGESGRLDWDTGWNEIWSYPDPPVTDAFTLFSSFQSASCGNTDRCRNEVDGQPSNGWVAFGNVPQTGPVVADDEYRSRQNTYQGTCSTCVEPGKLGKKQPDPTTLWSPGVVFEKSAKFWTPAVREWRHVTFTTEEASTRLAAYESGKLFSVGTMAKPVPRIFREHTYVGANPHAPFVSRALTTMALSSFRLYERSLTAIEAQTLFVEPQNSHCCIVSGLRDSFDVASIDLSADAMGGSFSSVSFRPSMQDSISETAASAGHSGQESSVELDICVKFDAVTECHGSISDGRGPYGVQMDCAVHLQSFIGSTYTLRFESFQTAAGDVLFVHDGPDASAPLLAQFSGSTLPPTVTSSTPHMFIRFVADNDLAAGQGFRAFFDCTGTELEYWKPEDVATYVPTGVRQKFTTNSDRASCISNSLLGVQCCSDSEMSCAKSRVTEIRLGGHGLRGTVPNAIARLGALTSVTLADNFISGTLPSSISQLHRLHELQLGKNQLAMQEQRSLSAILEGMLHLRTLDLSMSDEVTDLGMSIILPPPPLNCRVGDMCAFTVATRTATGLHLPHGGLGIAVHSVDRDSLQCSDLMTGEYSCDIPDLWTSHQGRVVFSLSADGEEFVPIRTLHDPTTGSQTVANTYSSLSILVMPILCRNLHSFPSNDGSFCQCETGYYRREGSTAGDWSCEHCGVGEMPVDLGTRCEKCPFGRFSATGEGCQFCSPGFEPNLDMGADGCDQCAEHSFSVDGSQCLQCPPDEVADRTHTKCKCPLEMYNTTGRGGKMVKCLAHGLRGAVLDAASTCQSCGDLECVHCGASSTKLVIRSGWAATDQPYLVFKCPFEGACQNTRDQRCKTGHTGLLCAVCEPGYGLDRDGCVRCSSTNSNPYTLLLLLAMACVVAAVIYLWRRRDRGPDGNAELVQLVANPLQGGNLRASSSSSSGGGKVAAVAQKSHVLLRVVYQPVRIIVGYIQVVTQIGPVLDLEFPRYIRTVLEALKPFMIDLQSILQLDCLSNGLLDFYASWVVRVFVIPAAMLGFVGLQYCYERRRVGHSTAVGLFKANAFVVVFLCYPGVCNQAFGMFNCRKVGGNLSVLVKDYSIHCSTEKHTTFQVIAGLYIAVVAFGIPLRMARLMFKRMREYGGGSASDNFVARRVGDELKISDELAADAIRDCNTGREYSFLVNAFKPRYYFWEVSFCNCKAPTPLSQIQLPGLCSCAVCVCVCVFARVVL